MKKVLKIDFVDFWYGFIKENNYFFNLLSQYYDIIIDEKPDILFYSCYGNKYLKYTCLKIFYTAENVRPDFTACDYAITFDYIDKKNHHRLPLYAWYINDVYDNGTKARTLQDLFKVRTHKEILDGWKRKRKFCCMVVSNGEAKKRLEFFKKLNNLKHVDSGGKVLNNIGGPVKDKLEFIKDYKLVVSFENSSYPGYVTEKILEPLMADCIPIYWGNPLINRDFNTKRFLNYHDFNSEDEFLNKIIEIDNNDDLALKMLSEPIFPNNEIPVDIRKERILEFLRDIIENQNECKPVSRTYKKYLHTIKRRWRILLFLISTRLIKKIGRFSQNNPAFFSY